MNIFRNSRGFTLLEVLLAISIFSVALLLFSAYFVNSFTISKTGDRELVAMNLARQIAEQYKKVDYDDLDDEIDEEKEPLTVDINGTTYEARVKLEKLSLAKLIELPENEHMIQRLNNSSTEKSRPILIAIHINIEGSSHSLATIHTMVVQPERSP